MKPAQNFNAKSLANRRLVAFTYQDNLFDLIFGDMKDDFTNSNLKSRFEIPERGLALKKVETCFSSNGLLNGFRFYDKQDKNIFEWGF